jgi:hypothetical protein
LAFYEAASNEADEVAEHLILDEHPEISAGLRDYGVRANRDLGSSPEMVAMHGNGDYVAYALEAANWIVEGTARAAC